MEPNTQYSPYKPNNKVRFILTAAFIVAGISIILWFLYAQYDAFLAENDAFKKSLNEKLELMKNDLKEGEQNYIEQKFIGFTEIVQKLIEEGEETPVDPTLIASAGDISSLSIAPDNLMRNSSFEVGNGGDPNQWDYILDSTVSNTYQSKEGIRSGAYGLKFEGHLSTDRTGIQLGIAQPITKTVSGRTYTMSLYVKSVNVAEGTTLRFGFWDEYNNKYAYMQEVPLLATQDWYRVSTTQTTSGQITDGANWYPMLEVRNHKYGAVYIEDVLLTEGSSLIAYSSSSAGTQTENNSTLLGNGSIVITTTGTMYSALDGAGSLGTNSNSWHDLYLINATINENGDMNLAGDLSVGDNLTVNGKTTLNGEIILGDNANDTLTFNGTSRFPGGISAGNNEEFVINNTGNITKINGVSYAYPTTQGSATTVLINDGSGNLSWGTFGAASVTADSLDFAQFVDNMTLDANTSVNMYNGTASRDLRFYNSDSLAELLYLEGTSDNVGVGNTNPAFNLDVNGSFNTTSFYLSSAQVTSSAAEINHLDGATVVNGGIIFGDGSKLTQDAANLFWSDSTNRLGIGTTNPSFTLDVNGDVRVQNGFDFYVGSIGLNDTGTSRTTSGAFKIGTFDEFTNSSSTNVQDVLDDLDQSITTFSTGAGDIEGVGSMMSGEVFNSADADDQWLGLGANAGRIEFDNEPTNEMNIMDAYLGIGTTTPSQLLSVGLVNQFTVDSSGNLNTSGTITTTEVFKGSIALGASGTSALTSGASVIGFYDNVDNGTSGNVQDVIRDIDLAIGNRNFTDSLVLTDAQTVTAALDGLNVAVGGTAYTSTNYVTAGNDVETAIASLDSAIASAAGDYITAAGNITSGAAFTSGVPGSNLFIADTGWIGIGTAAGRIYFDDTTTDTVALMDSNVGIGTIFPQALLNVSKSGSGDQEVARFMAQSGNPFITIGSSLTSSTGGYIIWRDPVDMLGLGIHGTEPFLNLRGGNVGIGTTNPGEKLDVIGNIRTNGQLISTVATGTSPLSVTSTTAVLNLNADMVDGHHTDTAYNSFGNGTIPIRHSSGYLFTNYLNTTADVTAAAATHFAIQTNNDAYIRWQTPANARTSLGLIAGGAGDIWVEKAGDTMTGSLAADGGISTDGNVVLNGTDTWLRVAGDNGIYFSTYGTGIHSPIADGGNYGSVSTYGAETNYEGYSIAGNYVLMGHTSASNVGLYNDINNRWIMLHNTGTSTDFYEPDSSTIAMRIEATGEIGIGTTAPVSQLDVYNANGATVKIGGATNNQSKSLEFGVPSRSEGRIQLEATTLDMSFSVLNSSGDILSQYMTLQRGGELGIGTNTPSQKLHVANGAMRVAGPDGTTSAANGTIEIYADRGDDANDRWSIYSEASSNILRIATDANARRGCYFSQYVNCLPVYDNTTASAANVNITTDGILLRSTSSLRYKTDIRDLPDINGLEIVNKMKPVVYKSKAQTDDPTLDYFGFIAEDLDSLGVAPLVVYDEKGRPDGVNYERITTILTKAIQQQQNLITDNKINLSKLTDSYTNLTLADFALTSKIDALGSGVVKNTQDITVDESTIDILDLQSEVKAFEESFEIQKQEIASLQTKMNQVFDILHKSDQVASEEADLTALTERVSFLEQMLFGGDKANASEATKEASISQLDNTNSLEDLTISGKLNVYDLGVVGDINTGQIVVHGKEGELNSLTEPLKIQSYATNPVEIMQAKVIIDTQGNLEVKGTVKANKFEVDESQKESASIGEGTLKAGEIEVVIETTSVTETSKIFLTPTKETDIQLAVVEKERGKSFKVKILKKAEQDISFNWWIVN